MFNIDSGLLYLVKTCIDIDKHMLILDKYRVRIIRPCVSYLIVARCRPLNRLACKYYQEKKQIAVSTSQWQSRQRLYMDNIVPAISDPPTK